MRARITQASISVLLLMVTFFYPTSAAAITLRVAVATNFRACFEILTSVYQQEVGDIVQASYASSGMLYAQIRSGAPFDAFFSADSERARLLIEQHLAAPNSRITYALGGLVFWIPQADKAPNSVRLDQILKDPQQSLVLANPEFAPYGLAARQVLTHLDLWQGHQKQFILAPSVSQAMHYLVSGAVAQGLIARAQVLSQNTNANTYWKIPEDWHAPIRQDAVVLNGPRRDRAGSFLHWVASSRVQKLIQNCGYELSDTRT